jgi:hypothetical protein
MAKSSQLEAEHEATITSTTPRADSRCVAPTHVFENRPAHVRKAAQSPADSSMPYRCRPMWLLDAGRMSTGVGTAHTLHVRPARYCTTLQPCAICRQPAGRGMGAVSTNQDRCDSPWSRHCNVTLLGMPTMTTIQNCNGHGVPGCAWVWGCTTNINSKSH